MTEDLRILIIDDMFTARRVLERLLSKLGYTQITEASTGATAMKKIASDKYDLIICDFNLTDMKGTDILKQLSSTEHESIPFIMVTSDLWKEDFEQMKEEGLSHYLLKPYTKDALEEAIAHALSGKPSVHED
ncbi:response regulator [Oligoflexia bacterium]|nr:response regulator [Oligoflexia bacterium]